MQFNSDGSIFSDESADTMRLGASTSNPFNFRPDTGLGISPELTAAASRSVAGGDGGALAARAAGVNVGHTGAQRVIIGGPTGGGPVTSHDAVQINTWDNANGESGLLATARRDGTPRPASELRDSDMIEIDGVETTVAVARRLGFIKANSRTGILENVSSEALKEATGEAEQERAAQAAEKAAQDSRAAQEASKLADPAAEAAAQTLASTVSENTVTRALMEIAENGEVSERAILRAASEAGVADPAEMQATVATAMAGFVDQAKSFLTDRGVDPQAFQAWARTEHPTAFRASMMEHVRGRDVSAYGALADQYMANLDKIDPQAILGATFPEGIKAHYSPGERLVLLDIPGHGTMRWAAALRAGIIGPHRRG